MSYRLEGMRHKLTLWVTHSNYASGKLKAHGSKYSDLWKAKDLVPSYDLVIQVTLPKAAFILQRFYEYHGMQEKKRGGGLTNMRPADFLAFWIHLQGRIHLSAGCLGIPKPCLQQVLSSERPTCLKDAWRNSPGLRCCSRMRLSDEKGAREEKKMIAKGGNTPGHGSQCFAFPWRVAAMFSGNRSQQLFSFTPQHAKNYLSHGYTLTCFSSSFRRGNPVV